MNRSSLTCCTILLAMVVWGPAVHAAVAIRVLLYQDVPHVEVTAENHLTVRVPGGEVRAAGSRLVITPRSGRVQVNGKSISSDRVVVRGQEQDLRVRAAEAKPKDTVRSPGPEPKARFENLPSVLSKKGPRPEQKGSPEAGSGLVVGGDLHVLSREEGLLVINVIDLEEYVEGVVPSEMNAGWSLEALKAQAVATRTYALYQQMMHADKDYDLVATVQDQVYGGRLKVDERVRQAVGETKGLAVTFQERPILAAFSSTAAGPTEDVTNVWSQDLPYLKGVECPFDSRSPYYRWTTTFRIDMLETKLQEAGVGVGTVATVTPFAYSRAGRVTKLRVLHSRGELVLRGEDLRRVIGYRAIPSTQFTIEAIGQEIVLSGNGAGHAVGLCQWGAKELAQLGYPFTTILRYYYPGTKVTRAWRLDPMPLHDP